MNWEAIGAIGEVLGAAFVFASLVYLATQIRQSRRTITSQNIHAETEQVQRLMEMQAGPMLQAPLRKLSEQEELTYEEANQVEAFLLSNLAVYSGLYRHHLKGLEASSSWKIARRRVGSLFLTSWARSWWQEAGRLAFEPEFVEEMDSVIERAPSHADPLARAMLRQQSTE